MLPGSVSWGPRSQVSEVLDSLASFRRCLTFLRVLWEHKDSGVIGRSNDLTLKTDAGTIMESLLGVSNQHGASVYRKVQAIIWSNN